jgi:integral membrane protein
MSDVRSRLTFFRVMAFIVGFALLVLTLHMVLNYGFDNDVLGWWAMPHGFLYMVYLVSVLMLGTALHWGLARTVGVMLAGCVPFLSFWVEHRVSRRARAQIEAAATPEAAAPTGNLAR